MALKGLNELAIAKEKFNLICPEKVPSRVDKEKFQAFISAHPEVFTWEEDTDEGRKILANIDRHPDPLKILSRMQRVSAKSFYDKKKGYYRFQTSYHEGWGIFW